MKRQEVKWLSVFSFISQTFYVKKHSPKWLTKIGLQGPKMPVVMICNGAHCTCFILPRKAQNQKLIDQQSSRVANVYEGAFRSGNTVQQYNEIKCILFEGLYFSRFNTVFKSLLSTMAAAIHIFN